MGGWHLEAFKFSLYIFAPVGAFWYYHQADTIESNYDKLYSNTITEQSIRDEKLIREAQQKMRELRDKRFQKELDELNKSKDKSE